MKITLHARPAYPQQLFGACGGNEVCYQCTDYNINNGSVVSSDYALHSQRNLGSSKIAVKIHSIDHMRALNKLIHS